MWRVQPPTEMGSSCFESEQGQGLEWRGACEPVGEQQVDSKTGRLCKPPHRRRVTRQTRRRKHACAEDGAASKCKSTLVTTGEARQRGVEDYRARASRLMISLSTSDETSDGHASRQPLAPADGGGKPFEQEGAEKDGLRRREREPEETGDGRRVESREERGAPRRSRARTERVRGGRTETRREGSCAEGALSAVGQADSEPTTASESISKAESDIDWCTTCACVDGHADQQAQECGGRADADEPGTLGEDDASPSPSSDEVAVEPDDERVDRCIIIDTTETCSEAERHLELAGDETDGTWPGVKGAPRSWHAHASFLSPSAPPFANVN
jgi:hypothetical protein